MRLTPRLSRRRANSVCRSWHSWTRSDDVCFGQELVRDELTGSQSNSECVAPGDHCGDRVQQAHLTDFLLGRGRVQVRQIENNFCFLWSRSKFIVGSIKCFSEGWHQDRLTEDVTIVDAQLICQASVFLKKNMSRVISTDVLVWSTQLKFWIFFHWVVRTNPKEGACSWEAVFNRVSAATIPRTRLHPRGPSTSRVRCFHPAAAACLGRRQVAARASAPP